MYYDYFYIVQFLRISSACERKRSRSILEYFIIVLF